MRGSVHRRRALTWVNALVILAMVLMPVGQLMPTVPGADSIQSGTATSLQTALVSTFGVLTEDDVEVVHHDFTVYRHPTRGAPLGTAGWLISFLWTERLHRPPIS